ncbi:MAG: hypothetical protein H0T83_04580 [Chthoniobacterales bacterium]|nr:hypothetical protein [Chthoniobacterales bacterium]
MQLPALAMAAVGIWLGSLAASRADTFTVTTTAPAGPGSLGEAIEGANANPGADTIGFNIPGTGLHTITAGDIYLPEITDPVTIDGYTQPGASANTLAVGDNAVILIRIDGSPTGSPGALPSDGLTVSAGHSNLRGLAITGFSAGIALTAGGSNAVTGNFIGLNPDDLGYAGGNANGISIASANNQIGGTLPADRNIIAHNLTGIDIRVGGDNNIVEGNYLGTDPSGTTELANGIGIFVEGTANQIGGLAAEVGNLIAGGTFGVDLFPAATLNVLHGNLIGSDVTGTEQFTAYTAGVMVHGTQNTIGGLELSAGNRIWYSFRAVVVQSLAGAGPPVGNSILSNSISGGVGIDLDASGIFDGLTRNDIGDADTGPNELQNFPILTSTERLTDRTTVKGGLNSTPSTTFTIQFFSQGITPADSFVLATRNVTTNAAGLVTFTFDLDPMPFDLLLFATATDPEGNTSEMQIDYATQLANVSTRGFVGTGDDLLIGGFIVRPADGLPDVPKRVLVRALGPSLALNGVPLAGRLKNPALELHDASGAIIAANDDWRSDQQTEILATGLAPSSDLEATLIADLPAGAYTAHLRGTDSGTGLALFEAYDLDPLDPPGDLPSGRLANVSSRGFVGSENNALIGGLIVNGDQVDTVLLRAIGPELAASQVANSLSDPVLEVRDASGALLASNDNWRDTQEAEIGGTGIPPGDDRSAALLYDFFPGTYTAIVRGANGATGTALIEAYDLTPQP